MSSTKNRVDSKNVFSSFDVGWIGHTIPYSHTLGDSLRCDRSRVYIHEVRTTLEIPSTLYTSRSRICVFHSTAPKKSHFCRCSCGKNCRLYIDIATIQQHIRKNWFLWVLWLRLPYAWFVCMIIFIFFCVTKWESSVHDDLQLSHTHIHILWESN